MAHGMFACQRVTSSWTTSTSKRPRWGAQSSIQFTVHTPGRASSTTKRRRRTETHAGRGSYRCRRLQRALTTCLAVGGQSGTRRRHGCRHCPCRLDPTPHSPSRAHKNSLLLSRAHSLSSSRNFPPQSPREANTRKNKENRPQKKENGSASHQ
jgi:hypothetical protein